MQKTFRVRCALLVTALLACWAQDAHAQEFRDKSRDRRKAPTNKFANNSFYIELGGSAILYSINYDHLFMDALAIRIGTSHVPSSFTALLIGVSYSFFSEAGNGLEVGISGGAFLDSSQTTSSEGSEGYIFKDSSVGSVWSVNIGYRSQPLVNDILYFRSGLTVSVISGLWIPIPLPHFSLGFSF